MITKEKAAQQVGLRAAGGTRRGGVALPLPIHNTPKTLRSQMTVPTHLTPTEAELWLAAEASKGTDPIEYRERRRRLLLAQAERWEVSR